MVTRKLVPWVVLGAVALLFLTGSAAAQNPPKIHAWMEFDPQPSQVEELPQTRQANFPTTFHFRVEGQFVCPTQVDVSVHGDFAATFPGWAGASLVTEQEKTVIFNVPQGAHTEGVAEKTAAGPTLNLFWDEDAQVNHTHTYEIGVDEVKIVSQADCIQSLVGQAPATPITQINITYPYYAPDDTGQEEVACDVDPSQKKCQETAAPQEDSPGFGAALLVAALVGALMVARRRGGSN